MDPENTDLPIDSSSHPASDGLADKSFGSSPLSHTQSRLQSITADWLRSRLTQMSEPIGLCLEMGGHDESAEKLLTRYQRSLESMASSASLQIGREVLAGLPAFEGKVWTNHGEVFNDFRREGLSLIKDIEFLEDVLSKGLEGVNGELDRLLPSFKGATDELSSEAAAARLHSILYGCIKLAPWLAASFEVDINVRQLGEKAIVEVPGFYNVDAYKLTAFLQQVGARADSDGILTVRLPLPYIFSASQGEKVSDVLQASFDMIRFVPKSDEQRDPVIGLALEELLTTMKRSEDLQSDSPLQVRGTQHAFAFLGPWAVTSVRLSHNSDLLPVMKPSPQAIKLGPRLHHILHYLWYREFEGIGSNELAPVLRHGVKVPDRYALFGPNFNSGLFLLSSGDQEDFWLEEDSRSHLSLGYLALVSEKVPEESMLFRFDDITATGQLESLSEELFLTVLGGETPHRSRMQTFKGLEIIEELARIAPAKRSFSIE